MKTISVTNNIANYSTVGAKIDGKIDAVQPLFRDKNYTRFVRYIIIHSFISAN